MTRNLNSQPGTDRFRVLSSGSGYRVFRSGCGAPVARIAYPCTTQPSLLAPAARATHGPFAFVGRAFRDQRVAGRPDRTSVRLTRHYRVDRGVPRFLRGLRLLPQRQSSRARNGPRPGARGVRADLVSRRGSLVTFDRALPLPALPGGQSPGARGLPCRSTVCVVA